MKAGKVVEGGRGRRQLHEEEDERMKSRDVDREALAHMHTSGKRLQLARQHA